VSSEGKQGVVVSEPIHPEVRIGHTHLRVADLERATSFYRDVLERVSTASLATGMAAANLRSFYQ
jgi:catechol-2,3-dioxygenase